MNKELSYDLMRSQNTLMNGERVDLQRLQWKSTNADISRLYHGKHE